MPNWASVAVGCVPSAFKKLYGRADPEHQLHMIFPRRQLVRGQVHQALRDALGRLVGHIQFTHHNIVPTTRPERTQHPRVPLVCGNTQLGHADLVLIRDSTPQTQSYTAAVHSSPPSIPVGHPHLTM